MKVEIWSDIVCPFCYIGKRRFEAALNKFSEKESVKVEWKSFQLNPDQEENIELNAYEYLAKSKNKPLEWSRNAHQYVTALADEEGLYYNFDIAKPTNTFKAHILLQMAKELGKGNEMKEKLCYAYFTQGKLISDPNVLADIGSFLGMTKENILISLNNERYIRAVENDIQESQSLGISAVPTFVFERKFAVSGAQSQETFLSALKNVYHHLGS